MVRINSTFKQVLFGLLFLVINHTAAAATITASVDRQQINEGESFQLTLEVKGDPDGDPDFSPLESQFEILGRNKSSSMQIINGSISSRLVWELSLMPKQRGELNIPPIAFGADKSNSVKISVSRARTSQAGSGAKDLFLQVSAEPTQTHVQAQVIYTIRVYVAANITNASLSEPSLSDADAVVEKLGEDRRFETSYQGQHYQVVERRYAIFPQQSGKLTIAPIVFNAQMIQTSRYMLSPFPQAGQTRRIQSKAIEIDIKAKPATQTGNAWLPARNVRLEEEWPQEPPEFKVGEAVTRTLTLSADGLTAAQLPEIPANTPAEFKAYPDQPVLNDQKNDNGVIGVRQEKIAMIATQPGVYELPEIKLSWWNTATQKPETARIAKRKIKVLPAAGGTRPTGNKPENKPVATPAGPLTINPAPLASAKQNTSAGFWPWLSLFLTTGWLATLIILWRQRRRNIQAAAETHENNARQELESRKQLEKKIKQACLDDNARAAKQAILTWGKTLYPEKDLNSLNDIGKHLGGAVADELNKLNQALYSHTVHDWHGQSLWDSIQAYNTGQKKIKPRKKDALAPLYLTQ